MAQHSFSILWDSQRKVCTMPGRCTTLEWFSGESRNGTLYHAWGWRIGQGVPRRIFCMVRPTRRIDLSNLSQQSIRAWLGSFEKSISDGAISNVRKEFLGPTSKGFLSYGSSWNAPVDVSWKQKTIYVALLDHSKSNRGLDPCAAPTPPLFTTKLFLDFQTIFFRCGPSFFVQHTIHQVIWPSPGTLHPPWRMTPPPSPKSVDSYHRFHVLQGGGHELGSAHQQKGQRMGNF